MKLYPATISQRLGAFAIDYFALIIALGSIGVVFYALLDAFRPPDWVLFTYAFVLYAVFFFYLPLCETFFRGKTLGKYFLSIRVVSADGSPVSGVQAFQRYLMLSFDFVLSLGFGGLICAMVTRQRQRFGDLLADTVVVRDNPHFKLSQDLQSLDYHELSPYEQQKINEIDPHQRFSTEADPTELATTYQSIQADIASHRTNKSHPVILEFLERLSSSAHLTLFRHKGYTLKDLLIFTLRSIPRAVYEARWAVLTSLAVAILAYCIGIYSQVTDHDSFEQIFGESYSGITQFNIADGRPMGIYSSQDEYRMFFNIFFNNLFVSLRIYIMGLFTFIGPVFMLLNNFVSFAVFDTFFVQHGFGADVLITPHEHGVLELSSIIMVGGASIYLGTGWLFPGRLTRLKAFARCARRSLLIVLSTIPMLFVAAFIESFITRHTEWPLYVKLGIVIISSLIILGYYVMLPIIARKR